MAKLKALGVSAKKNKALYQFDGPHPNLLERFKTPAANNGAVLTIDISVPEFSCLCPITGQPDTATIKISYTPDSWCVESKSLKLYMMSFRNAGAFHEACVSDIGNTLVSLLDPKRLSVRGEFAARGGIPFVPEFVYSKNPHFTMASSMNTKQAPGFRVEYNVNPKSRKSSTG